MVSDILNQQLEQLWDARGSHQSRDAGIWLSDLTVSQRGTQTHSCSFWKDSQKLLENSILSPTHINCRVSMGSPWPWWTMDSAWQFPVFSLNTADLALKTLAWWLWVSGPWNLDFPLKWDSLIYCLWFLHYIKVFPSKVSQNMPRTRLWRSREHRSLARTCWPSPPRQLL